MPSWGSGPRAAWPFTGFTGVSRYSYNVARYRLSSYMPPMAARLAETADWPWRKSITYIVIWPSVMRAAMVASATQA